MTTATVSARLFLEDGDMKVSRTLRPGLVLLARSGVLAQAQYAIVDMGGAGELGFTLGNGLNDYARVVGEVAPLFGGMRMNTHAAASLDDRDYGT